MCRVLIRFVGLGIGSRERSRDQAEIGSWSTIVEDPKAHLYRVSYHVGFHIFAIWKL